MQEIGGRRIKVNVTEKPLQPLDFSPFQAEESKFIDSPHKVYVGNLAKTVTTESLIKFFSGRGKALSAKVSRVPGTSKSRGFGFVSFSSEEDVEAAIESCNGAVSFLLHCSVKSDKLKASLYVWKNKKYKRLGFEEVNPISNPRSRALL